MLIKNVKATWLFLNRVDDNGKYRVTFYPNKEQDKQIKKLLADCAKENGSDIKDCQWKGGYKLDDAGEVTYTAKATAYFTNKQGIEVERKVNVFNIHAQKFAEGEVPNVANGAIVNLEVNPYFVKSKMGKGAMLGLNAVQLIEYEIYQGGGGNPFADESADNAFKAEATPASESSDDGGVDIF